MLTVTPAQIVIDQNGIPHSKQYDDTYFSSAGGAEECQHVFLDGNDFQSRIRNTAQFTVAEIGFGTGINFLTTANVWRNYRQNNAKLHYISIEKHPITVSNLRTFYAKLNKTFFHTEDFLSLYPLPVSGSHRIDFEQSGISLTLIFADALAALKEADFLADAWFLDGFAPSKNPELWTKDIAVEIFQLTKNKGTFASYTAAAKVKDSFSSAGFIISKQKGFSNKRDMLTGIRAKDFDHQFSIKEKSWFFNKAYNSPNKHALIIGGGLAGTTVCAALANRNWHVTVIDRHSTLAAEASGNANAILMPRLSVDHDRQAQLTLQGYFYSLRYLHKLETNTKENLWHPCGVIQIPRDQAQWQRMQTITSQEKLPDKLLQTVSKQEASDLCGCSLAHAGWYFPSAGWVVPKLMCDAILKQHENIKFKSGEEIAALENHNGIWHALNNDGTIVEKADVVIIANALSAANLEQTHWCKLYPKRGQITLIPEHASNIQPKKIICADAYITPLLDHHLVAGASFISNDTEIDIRAEEHRQNLQKIQNIIPGFLPPQADSLNGRAAIRAASADRLPIVGPVAKAKSFKQNFIKAALGANNIRYSAPEYFDGLYIASGFGSRGMAWIPICAEALACIINNEPKPLSQSLSNAIHPNRILMKQLIKSVQYEQ